MFRLCLASLLAALLAVSTAAEEGVASGFSLSVVTDRVPNARQMAETDSGLLLVGSRTAGNLYAVVLAPDRQAEVVTFASGLSLPSGLALIGDDLYVAARNRVLRYPDIERTFRDQPQPELVTDALPNEKSHGWKYLSLGPDGYLYVPVGAPCNICQREDPFATILRMHPGTGETSIYARGVRNSVGMDWHPDTGRLWFTDNGRDWLGDDLPPDEVNVVAEAGAHYGYPHIHGADIVDPQFGTGHDPADYVAPVYEIQAHSATLGMAFYTAGQFPRAYDRALFIAEHGSWNRSSKVGYQVSVVRAGATVAVPFVDVWLEGEAHTGRPADVLVARDGSLLISDDYGGRIYRVTAPAVNVNPTSLRIAPGRSASYTVALSVRPTADVTVAVGGATAEVSVDGSPLLFTPMDWRDARTVTVSAVSGASDTVVTLSHAVSGGDYEGLAAPAVTVTITNDDDDDDGGGGSSNQPPMATDEITTQVVDVGASVDIDLSDHFRDPDRRPLTYAAESADIEVAMVEIVEGTLTVRGVGHGMTAVTVTATDHLGLTATQRFEVTAGRMVSFADIAQSVPEGGTAELTVRINRPRNAPTMLTYVLGVDDDPNSSDADEHDHGGENGTASIAAGETETLIEIAIRDDADIEPARETFTVTLEMTDAQAADFALGTATVLVTIDEGVCDRTPKVRDALRGSRSCEATSDKALAGRLYLGMRNRGITAVRVGDFSGLTGLRTLNLRGNRLKTLPAGVFADLAELRNLWLSDNALTALPADLFGGLAQLNRLRLESNALAALPAGVFEGLANLTELQLQNNPGAPFPLTLTLTRTDAQPWSPGPAEVVARVSEGAPFAMRAGVSTVNGTLSADAVDVSAGTTVSAPITVTQTGEGATRLTLDVAPTVPEARCGEFDEYPCFQGIATAVGQALVLFKHPPMVRGSVPDAELATDGDAVRIELSRLFAASDGGALTYAARSSDPLLATVIVNGSVLTVISNEADKEGTVTITVTATDSDGVPVTLVFEAKIETMPRGLFRGWRKVLLPQASQTPNRADQE